MQKHYEWKTDLINQLKFTNCKDCHIRYNPWIMQFDHRDPSRKKGYIHRFRCRSLNSLLEEIAKCDVVCSNCHCHRTHLQRETKKALRI